MSDFFDPRWKVNELTAEDFGPFAPANLSDAEKEAVWEQYRKRQPTRTPMLLGLNNRVALLDRRNNPGGLTYKQVFNEPIAMLKAQLLHQYIAGMRYHRFCDYPTALPETWRVMVHLQNVYEAWFFGCPVDFHPDQVPDTVPIYTGDNKRAIFDIDITRPLERPPFSTAIAFTDFLTDYVKDKTFLGRPIAIDPPGYNGTDGPVTVAMNVRGADILSDMIDDPDYANQLFRFIVDAALERNQAVSKRCNLPLRGNGMADDSIALIGESQYRELVLPHHRHWYDSIGATFGDRSIHLCGDATRYFPLLKEELGITRFDTGFPVDFAGLRKALGPDVEISGGVEVGLLITGTPQQVYTRSKAILTSGIKDGGRFVFREGNNLPPNVPWANLAAMYRAVFDFGKY